MLIIVVAGILVVLAPWDAVPSPHERVWSEFSRVKTFISLEYYEEDGPPPAELRQVMRDWSRWSVADRNSYANEEYCPLLRSGVDPWGNMFIYKRDSENSLVIIRSCGPNGLDDGARGDDIQRAIPFTAKALTTKHTQPDLLDKPPTR